MARLLITGASGLLGINLASEAMSQHDIIGVDRGKLANAPFQVVQEDLSDLTSIEPLLDAVRPAWLINCAAIADLDVCEEYPDRAKILNTDMPGEFAKACKKRGISMVHISTDAVFDGQKDGFYVEQDQTNPLNVYARTKLDGEKAVIAENPSAIIARVNFYGWSLSGRRSLAEFFYNNLTNDKSMSGFTDAIFCPMLVNDTARVLIKMLKQGLTGLYHLVGPQSMSKYQFGVEIARKFNLREAGISPRSIHTSNLTAKRSHNLSLSTNKLSTVLNEPLPEFSTGLDEFYTQLQQDYPQKIRSYQQS
ncbi:MAG: SDR family oxidoreductase [Anaerolineales bacterium]|nr:SDR family oxidoreductase [Anaerolineales bacterium]